MRDLRTIYTKFASATILASVLLTPLSAHAQMAVIDPMSIAKQIQTMMQNAATSFTASAASVKSDAVNTNLAQAHVDAVDKSVHDAEWLKTHKQYTVDPTTYKACRVVQGAAARSSMGSGVASLTNSMGAANSQNVGRNQADNMARACGDGTVDPDENPTVAKAVKSGCTPDPTRIGADINSQTLFKEHQFPKGLKLVKGKLSNTGKPGEVKVTDDMTPEQKSYIDGFHLCARLLGPQAASFGDMGSKPGVAVVGFDDQQSEKLNLSFTYNACLKTLNSHTAITEEASQLGTDFKSLYNTQQQECQQLQDEGIADDAVTNCKKNGISKSAAERLEAARFGNSGFLKHLLGQKLDPHDVSQLSEHNRDNQLLLGKLDQLIELETALAANTQKPSSGGGPSVFDNPAK